MTATPRNRLSVARCSAAKPCGALRAWHGKKFPFSELFPFHVPLAKPDGNATALALYSSDGAKIRYPIPRMVLM